MAVKTNTTLSANVAVTPREIDFVSRFGANWRALIELLGIMRPIEKQPGAVLKAKTASVTLQTSAVAEGDEIPYSLASVTEVPVAEMGIEKYAKAVTIEAIKDHGYENAVARTDDAFLNELQAKVLGDFYSFLATGTLTGTYSSFQMALAKARGNVINAFRAMHLSMTQVVGFCNINDFYTYLGGADITVQSEFGFNYVTNFLGYGVLFLCADTEITAGTVIATPVENIVLYYVNPATSDFARAGLEFVVDGETPLIGFHTQGNYGHAVSECFAIMGMSLFAEYLNAISVCSFAGGSTVVGIRLTGPTAVAASSTITLVPILEPAGVTDTLTWDSSDKTAATVSSGVVTGVAAGTSTITATTTSGLTASLEVTVS